MYIRNPLRIKIAYPALLDKMGTVLGYGVAALKTPVALPFAAVPHLKQAVFVNDEWVPYRTVVPLPRLARPQYRIARIFDPVKSVGAPDVAYLQVTYAGRTAFVVQMKRIAGLDHAH